VPKRSFLSNIKLLSEGVIKSYSVIFYSQSYLLGFLLIAVTFLNPVTGLYGVVSCLTANVFAVYTGLNEKQIKEGLFGFNSVLIGIAVAFYFRFTAYSLVILIFISLFTVIISVWLSGWLGKYGLPYLSLPFMIMLWILLLASKQFPILTMNTGADALLFSQFGAAVKTAANFAGFNEYISSANLRLVVSGYLKSLSAILLQPDNFTGFIIAVGLLVYSRIAFTLSVIGYIFALILYSVAGVALSHTDYYLIGFNYILTAIAIGGFFTVPSLNSYLWIFFLTPIIALVIHSSSLLLSVVFLPVYSLPFCIVVILFLYFVKFRYTGKGIKLIMYNYYSPEKNLYKHLNFGEQFKNSIYYIFQLPFWSEWKVTQGYNGGITHTGDWAGALDFEIYDEEQKPYMNNPSKIEEYYCYNKPVLAPADGFVTEVVNHVDDNKPGEVNVNENWGNTVIIYHIQGLYSKLSHLKKGSIKVVKGQYVKKGDTIGYCGNSGRSPFPHLHFQVQTTPYIGSRTLEYPISYYLTDNNNSKELKIFEIPEKSDIVCNVLKNPLLKNAFNFLPGKIFNVKITTPKGIREEKWEVFTDAYNYTYIYCHKSKAYSYFVNNDTMLYFTDYEGYKKCGLYYFYIALNKVLLGFYPEIKISNKLPVNILNNKLLFLIQDFVAPFFQFINPIYKLEYKTAKDEFAVNELVLNTKIYTKIFNFKTKEKNFVTELKNDKISKIIFDDKITMEFM